MTDKFTADLRCGHCEGDTLVAYHPKRNLLYTGGVEGEIRVWDLDDADGNAMESVYIGTGRVNGIGLGLDKFYVTLANSHELKAYMVEDNLLDATITRFTAECSTAAGSRDGSLIAAGSSDFTFKIVSSSGEVLKTCIGHQAPILHLAFDPTNEFVASSSCDGSVTIWSVADGKRQWAFENNHKKSNDISNSSTSCRIDWQPTRGDLIACPSRNEIKLYSRVGWKLARSLKGVELPKDSEWVAARFNSTGSHLAGFSSKGTSVFVWNLSFENPIEFKHDNEISSLDWHPSTPYSLAVADKAGQFILLKISETAFDSERHQPATSSVNPPPKKDLILQQIDNLGSDFEDEDDDQPSQPASQPSTTGSRPKSNLILDEAEDDGDGDGENEDVDVVNGLDDEDDDDILMDIGRLKAQYEPIINGETNSQDGDDAKSGTNSIAGGPSQQPRMRPINIIQPVVQKPFQPGSTPKNLEHRIMVYNSVGCVTAHRSADEGQADGQEESSVEVEFFDTNTHHTIHLDNSITNFTLADLSSDAVLFGSNDSEATNSHVLCIHFSSFDANKEWKTELPEDEMLDGVTVTNGFAALISDMRYLRLFSLDGVALQVLSLTGSLVTLASQESKLLVIYHQGHGTPENQNLNFMQYSVNIRRSTVVKQSFAYPLPVASSPSSTIAWAGFSDEGTATVVDSRGIVRLLKRPSSWIPLVDLKDCVKNKSDNYFVTGLSEVSQSIRGIYCKAATFPHLHIKPMVTSISFKMKICNPHVGKNVHEEEAMRLSMLSTVLTRLLTAGFDVESQLAQSHMKLVESLVKQFALAINANRESLALQIAELMPPRAIDGALRYAVSKRRTGLIQRLQQIKADKLDGTADGDDSGDEGHVGGGTRNEEEGDEIEDTPMPTESQVDENVIRPKPMRLGSKNRGGGDETSLSSTAQRKPPLSTSVSNAKRSNGLFAKRKAADSEDGDEREEVDSRASPTNEDDEEKAEETEEEKQNREGAFKLFFSLMREDITDDNPGVSEKELETIGRTQFSDLEDTIQAKWINKFVSKRNKKMKR